MASKRQLCIVFDTTVIKADSEIDVLRSEVRRFIGEHRSKSHDLSLSWHVPHMVFAERLHQMTDKAMTHFASVRRLEKLAGCNLGMTELQIAADVRRVASAQLETLGIHLLTIDPAKVDWLRMMDDAASRREPFESSGPEKGFRDACVLEAFSQLVDESPSHSGQCRLVLMTADKRLQEAAATRFAARANVRTLPDLAAAEDLINTLVSNVTEDFVRARRDAATTYFSDFATRTGLYFQASIEERVRTACSSDFEEQLTDTALSNKWSVQPAIFERKNKTRIFWTSRVQFETMIEHENRFDDAAARFEAAVAVALLAQSLSEEASALDLNSIRRPVRRWTRTINADVTWSVRLSDNFGQFEAPRIDAVQCRGARWAPA